MNKNHQSQCKSILNHLEQGKSLTPLEALTKFGCLRLGGRIYDLRKHGYIRTEMIKTKSGKHIARYWMDF